MAASPVPLSGENWQRWANLLLTQHYGPAEYQRVPDNDRGDAGLEGFTIINGHAYQAYGPEEPLTTGVRYEKHRDKMTRDIGKFINNRDTLSRLLGRVRVTRWVLFVPKYDSKEIVDHAAVKTAEVIAAGLSYVADGFRVKVSDEEDFAAERDHLLCHLSQSLGVQADDASQERIDDWADTHDAFISVLDGKIGKLPTLATLKQRQEFRNRVLKWYLEGQDILGRLRSYPTVYEKVIAAKSHRENFLVSASMVSNGSPAEVFHAALKAYMETAREEAKMLSSMTVEALAHEAVSDWMLRCPLDFPEVNGNA